MALGIALPLDFFRAAPALAYYQDAASLVQSYGLSYLLFGLGVLPVAVLAGVLARGHPRAADWWSTFLLIVVAGRTMRIVVGLPEFTLPWTVAGIASSALIAGWLARTTVVQSSLEFSRFATMVGLAVTGIAVLLTTADLHSAQPEAESAIKPKAPATPVIWISIDTVSAAHCGWLGYSRATTPHLDRLADQAYAFDRHYANANFTTPALGTLLRSQRPWRHRLLHLDSHGEYTNDDLLSVLRSAGYDIVVGPSNVAATPYRHGVVSAVHHLGRSKLSFSYNWVAYALERFGLNLGVLNHGLLGVAQRTIDRVLVASGLIVPGEHFDPAVQFDFVQRHLLQAEVPVFVWIHVFPPHDPYVTPAPFLGMFDPSEFGRSIKGSIPVQHWQAGADAARLKGRYDENLRFADERIGAFLGWLREQRIFDDALIVINSDHGESFRGGYGSHGGPLLSEDLIRVPLLIKLPHQARAVRVTTPAEQLDFAPTVLAILGIPIPNSMEGQPLLKAGQVIADHGPVFSMNFEQSRDRGRLDTGSVAMIDGDWKYVSYRGAIDYPNQPQLVDQLIDLARDPGEQHNLLGKRPDVARRMKQAIDEQLARHGGKRDD